MNDNQKKVLIAGGLVAGCWLAYRYFKKMPLLPMKAAEVVPAGGAPATNFSGYSNADGENTCQRLHNALNDVNDKLSRQGQMTPSEAEALHAYRGNIMHALGVINCQSQYGNADGDSTQYYLLSSHPWSKGVFK